MNPVRVAQSTALPFTGLQLLEHLRIPEQGTLTDHQTDLALAAVQYVEDYCGITVMDTNWSWRLDAFVGSRDAADDFWYEAIPRGRVRGGAIIKLPRPNLRVVNSIVYVNAQGVSTTMPTADYQVDTIRSRIAPNPAGTTWPQVGETLNNVEINYHAGYQNASDVPYALKLAIMELISYYHDQASDAGSPIVFHHLPHGFESKLSQFKEWGF